MCKILSPLSADFSLLIQVTFVPYHTQCWGEGEEKGAGREGGGGEEKGEGEGGGGEGGGRGEGNINFLALVLISGVDLYYRVLGTLQYRNSKQSKLQVTANHLKV